MIGQILIGQIGRSFPNSRIPSSRDRPFVSGLSASSKIFNNTLYSDTISFMKKFIGDLFCFCFVGAKYFSHDLYFIRLKPEAIELRGNNIYRDKACLVFTWHRTRIIEIGRLDWANH
jgi:hypothetical protein